MKIRNCFSINNIGYNQLFIYKFIYIRDKAFLFKYMEKVLIILI